MNPDMQLLLAEIQKLTTKQSTIQKQLAYQRDLLECRIQEANLSIEKRFDESDTTIERRILNSELRHDARFFVIEKATCEGVVDDPHLHICKSDKYWNRSMIQATIKPALILETPIKSEQHVAPPPARYMAARPNGHPVANDHRENEQELSPPPLFLQSWVWLIPLQNPIKLHGTAYDLVLLCNRPSDLPHNPTSKLPKQTTFSILRWN